MKPFLNTELIEVSFNTKTLKWSMNLLFINGNTIDINITNDEAKTIINNFNIEVTYNKDIVYYTPII